MLNRLFARNVPEDRVQEAIDHSKDAEQRDALRERSAAILERLERKRVEMQRIEMEQRQAAKEAVERAALHAETAAEAMPAIDLAGESEAAAGHDDTGAVAETAAGTFGAGAAETAAETGMYQPAPDGEEAATAADDYFSESAPLREPEAMPAETDYADQDETGMADRPATDFGAIDVETPEAGHAETASDAPETGYGAGDAHPARTHFLADEDPEVYEQIRRKAEEARARIAARLEQMQAGEAGEQAESGQQSRRVDLGEDAPPMFDDDDHVD